MCVCLLTLTSYSSVLQISSYSKHSLDSVQKLVLVLGLKAQSNKTRDASLFGNSLEKQVCGRLLYADYKQ